MIDLGKLERVDIRKVWPIESSDFTPWLAKHLDQLGDVLKLDFDPETLTEVRTEVSVGSFSADVVAEDTSGNKYLIENQYGNTDHDHLGKMITYAAGLGASTIIWVSEYVREEHQKAIEFLNNGTTSDLNFFLVQIEALCIGDSKPAPHFTVIEQPNAWGKMMRRTSCVNRSASDDLAAFKFNFWTKVLEFGRELEPSIKWHNPIAEAWSDLSTGKGFSLITMLVNVGNVRPPRVAVAYRFWPKEDGKATHDKALFDQFTSHKEDIEHELDARLAWDRLDDKGYSQAILTREGDYRDETQHDEIAKWLVETAAAFFRIMPKYDDAPR